MDPGRDQGHRAWHWLSFCGILLNSGSGTQSKRLDNLHRASHGNTQATPHGRRSKEVPQQ
eukprot:scaffold1881_cov256-Pinguiococcus_pyrenoidosus.AAC.15